MTVRNACSIFQADFWDIPSHLAINTDEAPLLEKIKEYIACNHSHKLSLVPWKGVLVVTVNCLPHSAHS